MTKDGPADITRTDMTAKHALRDHIHRADIVLQPHLRATPLVTSQWLGRTAGTSVLLKLENLQMTGSFKVRGALNKVLSLDADHEQRVIAASTGNHGAAVAYAASKVGRRATIFVPELASQRKLDKIIRYGAEVVSVPGDPLDAEVRARTEASNQGVPYISPYNDADVIAGQGTVGLEIVRQAGGPVDSVLVPLGGGGLAAGLAVAMKSAWPETRIIGCSPENSCVMIRSIEAGELFDVPSRPTLSDGTAGGIEAGSITFELCRDWVDDFVTVSEDEIAAALRSLVDEDSLVVEGAAATSAAAYQKTAPLYEGRTVVLVLSGGNISRRVLIDVLSA